MYYNARSLVPKFDELLILADSHNPDVICITESWLSVDIQDSEILIPGYQSLRHDRNRHGGGILMYVSHRFTVKLLPFHPSLELLTVTLHSGIFKFYLSLFYRPPSRLICRLFVFFLHNYLQSINIPQFSSFVLIGDFNINFSNSSHPSFSNLCNILSTFGLTQVVSDHTHVHQGNSHSLIDLVLMSNPSSLSSCQVIPPLSNSDHLGIKTEIQMRGTSEAV